MRDNKVFKRETSMEGKGFILVMGDYNSGV